MKQVDYRIWLSILFSILLTLSCNEHVKPSNQSTSMIRIWEFEKIEYLFNKNNDTTYIINFWATTCPPCIKELPYFEKINESYHSKSVKVILVNRDLEKHFESRVIPFVQKHNIHSQIFALHDENMSKWLDMVYPKWWGALPFTVIYKGNEKRYFLDPFENQADLEYEINEIIAK